MKHKEMCERLLDGEDALELSIEKWEDIVEGKGEDLGATNCALCQKYIKKECVDCPVYKVTRKTACERTPYREYEIAQSLGKPARLLKKLAQKEVDFLKSLRKPKRKV